MVSGEKTLILYSGGLDSLVMARLAEIEGRNVIKVFFDIGQPYVDHERSQLGPDVRQHRIDWLRMDDVPGAVAKSGSGSGAIFIPGRNAVMAVVAASIYLPDQIWVGALLGEMHGASTDKNDTFKDKINDLLGYVLKPFSKMFSAGPRVVFPLADKGFGKFEAVRWGLENGISKEAMLKSRSCLSASEQPCGECVVCVRRWGIFGQFGMAEDYLVSPLQSPVAKALLVTMVTSGHYDEYRKREIFPYLWSLCGSNLDADVLAFLSQ